MFRSGVNPLKMHGPSDPGSALVVCNQETPQGALSLACARHAFLTLLTIKLDDQLLVDRAVNVGARRQTSDAHTHVCALDRRNPGGTPASGSRLPRALDVRILTTRFLDGDGVALLNLEGGNVNLAPVDFDVTVIDELARLTTRGRKARAVDGIVQPALKQEQKVFARDPLLARGALEVVAELTFEDKIYAFDLLLLAQLLAVTDQRLAAP